MHNQTHRQHRYIHEYTVSLTLVVIFLSISDPPGTPEMFEACAGERQVNFTWSPPLQAIPVITYYTISCSPSPSSLPQSLAAADFLEARPITLLIAGFFPNTSYMCSVESGNNAGVGPPANVTFTTLPDCEWNQTKIVSVINMFSQTLTFSCFSLEYQKDVQNTQ